MLNVNDKLYEPFLLLFNNLRAQAHLFWVSIFEWIIPLILLLWNKSTNLCEIKLKHTMQIYANKLRLDPQQKEQQ